jgi:hypothetical protein
MIDVMDAATVHPSVAPQFARPLLMICHRPPHCWRHSQELLSSRKKNKARWMLASSSRQTQSPQKFRVLWCYKNLQEPAFMSIAKVYAFSRHLPQPYMLSHRSTSAGWPAARLLTALPSSVLAEASCCRWLAAAHAAVGFVCRRVRHLRWAGPRGRAARNRTCRSGAQLHAESCPDLPHDPVAELAAHEKCLRPGA